MRTLRILLTLAVVALLAPAVFAIHTPPGFDKVDGGKMTCDGRKGTGTAMDTTLPILRTTDNGHLVIAATGSAVPGVICQFAVVITGYALPAGINPTGGLANIASTPCSAGPSCSTWAEADWWVTFNDPMNAIFTPEIDIFFDLQVNGVTVDSGMVRIVEPSLPVITLP